MNQGNRTTYGWNKAFAFLQVCDYKLSAKVGLYDSAFVPEKQKVQNEKKYIIYI